jgi:hypothetical protein
MASCIITDSSLSRTTRNRVNIPRHNKANIGATVVPVDIHTYQADIRVRDMEHRLQVKVVIQASRAVMDNLLNGKVDMGILRSREGIHLRMDTALRKTIRCTHHNNKDTILLQIKGCTREYIQNHLHLHVPTTNHGSNPIPQARHFNASVATKGCLLDGCQQN